MKKLYTLSFILLASLSFGQTEVLTNGNLEAWTDTSTPTDFTATYTVSVTQESTIKHNGTYSAKHTTPAKGSVKIQNETAVLIPGNNYTISYWFLDNDPLAKSRPWIYFLNSSNTTITDSSTDAIFRPDLYSDDNVAWQKFTTTFTAPAGAVKLRFEIRTYAVDTGLGSVYYDDMSVLNNGTLSVNQNSIDGLNVYPNPVTKGTLYITSNSSDAKSVVVYDLLGKEVLNAKTSNNAVNVSSLKGGAYIVKITEDGKTDTKKLIIQ